MTFAAPECRFRASECHNIIQGSIERETEFKDRIRGEAIGPWGVVELQKAGLYDRLTETCGHHQPYLNSIGIGLLVICAQLRPNVCLPHLLRGDRYLQRAMRWPIQRRMRSR
jgi:hypothetical protein